MDENKQDPKKKFTQIVKKRRTSSIEQNQLKNRVEQKQGIRNN
jgi:hypothetical protein